MSKVPRYFFLLWLLCIIGFFAVLPFQAMLLNKPLAFTLAQWAIKLIQISIFYGVIIFIGAKLSARLGIKFLWLEKHINYQKQLLQPSLVGGIICACFLVLADTFIFHSLSPSKHDFTLNPLYGLGGAFYGAINEEVNLRLFFCTVIARLCMFIFKNRYKTWAIWLSIVVASLIFGAGHLHAVTAALTPLLITKIMLLNGIAGIIFGWLFWYRGFEVSMLAHFTTDVILFSIIPLIQNHIFS